MPAYNSWLTHWPFFADCEDSFIACENRLPWPGLILKFQQIMLLFLYLMISWQNNWHQIKILNEILSTSSSISAKSHFILLGISKHKKRQRKAFAFLSKILWLHQFLLQSIFCGFCCKAEPKNQMFIALRGRNVIGNAITCNCPQIYESINPWKWLPLKIGHEYKTTVHEPTWHLTKGFYTYEQRHDKPSNHVYVNCTSIYGVHITFELYIDTWCTTYILIGSI